MMVVLIELITLLIIDLVEVFEELVASFLSLLLLHARSLVFACG